MGFLLKKNHVWRCRSWLSFLNWIGVLSLSLLWKLCPRELEPWFVLWSSFLLRMLCISINLPYSLAWNTVVMSVPPLVSGLVEFLDKLQKRICRKNTDCLCFTLYLFSLYYSGRCSSELPQGVPLPYSWVRSTG